MIKAICFDLDGTLLPLDVESFSRHYFGMLAARVAPLGYEPKAFVGAIMKGTHAMYYNDGRATNETVFWNTFCSVFGDTAREDESAFAEFYETEFDRAREACGFDPDAAPTVRALQERGFRVAIATNPLFPEIATRKRLQWAGIDPLSVEFYTTYEDHRYCKPNPAYYKEVAARLSLDPSECLMVGNDVVEDMAAARAGMQVFLLVGEHLINPNGEDLDKYPHGGFDDLLTFVNAPK